MINTKRNNTDVELRRLLRAQGVIDCFNDGDFDSISQPYRLRSIEQRLSDLENLNNQLLDILGYEKEEPSKYSKIVKK